MAAFRPAVALVIVLVCAAIAVHSAEDAEKKDSVSSGSFTINPAEMAITQCREKAKTAFDHVRCFEIGYKADPHNYTWSASLALAYLSVDLHDMALQAMNHSAAEFLKAHAHLYANETLPDGQLNITFLNAVRRAYDEADAVNDTKHRDSVVDIAFMLAKMFELEHRVGEAHALYYGFMAQLGLGDRNVMDFHRRTGNVVAMAFTGGTETSIAFRLSEAFIPILDGITEHLMGRRGLPSRIDPPLRRYCGIEIFDTSEVKVTDVFDYVSRCIKGWGNLTAELKQVPDKNKHIVPFGTLRYTPAHRLAQVGAWPVLQELLNYLESTTVPGDRFGRGLTHYAAAWGQLETLKGLVAFGGRLDREDKGKIEARHLGCSSPTFDVAFEEVLGKGGCEAVARDRTEDDTELPDDSGNDGDWNPGAKLPKYLQCDIDVRDASKVTATDLLLAYVHSNHPVVLRNAFYDTDGPHSDWRMKRFAKQFGEVMMRQELAPLGERYGIGPANTTTIAEFIKNLKTEDGTVADVVVDTIEHPLYSLAKWTPPSFSNKKFENEIRMLNAEDSLTTVIINKVGSQSNHRARGFASFHATVFGQNDYTMLPPRFAKTTRGKLRDDDKKKALRCSLMTGDVLVLPELWSADYTAKRNGVMMERYVVVPARSERYSGGGSDGTIDTSSSASTSTGGSPRGPPPAAATEERDTTDEL